MMITEMMKMSMKTEEEIAVGSRIEVKEEDMKTKTKRRKRKRKRKITLHVEESSLLQNQEGSRSEMSQMKSIKEVNVILCFAVFVGLLKER